MQLKWKPFDVPTRPKRITLWAPSQVLLHTLALGVFGYASGTWLCLPLIVYILIVAGAFSIREWRWHRYADGTEATFVEIGVAANTLSGHLEAIATELDAREARAAQEATPRDEPASTPGAVQHYYWAATSKGQN